MKNVFFSIIGFALLFVTAALMASNPDAVGFLAIAPLINLTGVQELFRPDRVAQVILTTENYGTPILDRFYPEARRQAWPSVLVPRSKITNITRSVPVVRRGAPGISIGHASGSFEYIEPVPIKTFDAIGSVEFNNAQLAGLQSLQSWADERIVRHLQTHRLTTEGLAAQSLSGTVTWPIVDATGSIIDTYTIDFGNPETYTVQADWSSSSTTLGQIYEDLVAMRTQLRRKGYTGNMVDVGVKVFGYILDRVTAVTNDTRIPGRLNEDGSIQVGEFRITRLDAEYYHPGGVGGSPSAGYTKAIGDDDLVMWDSNAPWTLLRVRLDNFKMGEDPGPLGIITELTKDGGAIEMFAESKPLPIPVVESTLQTDVTDDGS